MRNINFLTIFLLIYCNWFFCKAMNCASEHYNMQLLTKNNNRIETFAYWFAQKVGTVRQIDEVCSNENGKALRRGCLYKPDAQTAEWQPFSGDTLLVFCKDINRVCGKEEFKHNYIHTDNVLKPNTNYWKPAKLWENAVLDKPCLHDNGMPVVRKCIYDPVQHTARWEKLNKSMENINCIRDTKQKVVTYNLNKLHQELSKETIDEISAVKKLKKLLNILNEPKTVRLAADIQLVSTIVKQITEHNTDRNVLKELVKIGSNLFAKQPEVLEEADILNATSDFRRTFENYNNKLAKVLMSPDFCETNKEGILLEVQDFISVLHINPICSNISGVALYPKDLSLQNMAMHFDSLTQYQYRYLYMNQSFDDLLREESLHSAVYIPLSLWSKLLQLKGNSKNEMILIYELYKTDGFFVETSDSPTRIQSPVSNIKITNFKGSLPENLRFILPIIGNKLQAKSKTDKPECGFWNKTYWAYGGVKTSMDNTSAEKGIEKIICNTNHLTNFGICMGHKQRHIFNQKVVLSVLMREQFLDVITVSGCSLSLAGLLFIWLTALLFKSWRAKKSHHVLMNMCVPLTLIMLFFLMINVKPWRDAIIDPQSNTHCLAMGAFLQYTILVLFSWMLIVAYLQYQRYVVVLKKKISARYIVKLAIFAWTIPMVPTALVAWLAPPQRYETGDEFEICYPTGNALYYGVIMPMTGTVAINVSIFIYILYSIRRTVNQLQRSIDVNLISRQIYLSILFFFLFGLSWIFGFLVHFSDIWSYLFCFTSTLQGFVLFVYFIVVDETTRMAWYNCLYPGSNKRRTHYMEKRSTSISATNGNAF